MHTYLKIGAAGSIVALIFTATVAFAHTQTPTTQIEPKSSQFESQQSSGKFKTERQRYQQEIGAYRARNSSTTIQSERIANLKERARNFRENSTTTIRSERVAQFKERAQQFRENHTSSSTRERIQERIHTFEGQNKERVAHRRERFQRHLSAIENKVKQRLVERLTKRFAYVNKVWTTHFSKRLDRYAAILQKIQDRSDSAAANGKDVTSVNASISLAQVAIQDAHVAISVQQAKTYTLDIPSVATSTTATSTPAGQTRIMQGFRTAFKSMRNQIFSDLSTLRSVSMVKVRTSVIAALQSLKKEQGSTTASPTTSSTTPVN